MYDRCRGLPINKALTSRLLKRQSIIEIGCGGGHLAGALLSAGYRGLYWGCDISPAAVKAAQKRLAKSAVLEVGQFEQLSEEGKVPNADVAFARSVIQHQPHWLPLAEAMLRHAPIALFVIIRSIYFKPGGEHEPVNRGTFYDVCISLEALAREAAEAGMACQFKHTIGRRGPEVLISLTRT
jgi:SAM-dependent methyltransferase